VAAITGKVEKIMIRRVTEKHGMTGFISRSHLVVEQVDLPNHVKYTIFLKGNSKQPPD